MEVKDAKAFEQAMAMQMASLIQAAEFAATRVGRAIAQEWLEQQQPNMREQGVAKDQESEKTTQIEGNSGLEAQGLEPEIGTIPGMEPEIAGLSTELGSMEGEQEHEL